jgi:hypothetical protein
MKDETRHGETEKGRRGDAETRRHEDTRISRLFSVSPLLRVCVSLFCLEDGP